MKQIVVLYDESRGMWVKLTDIEAYFTTQGSDSNADYWYLIGENPSGYWISETKFITQTGYFTKVDGSAVWIEQQAGSSCTFVEVSIDSPHIAKKPHDQVVLYDESRGMWVKLTDNKAYFNRQGGNPDADYWYLIAENPTGYWISDTKFVTKTGYFRKVDKDGVVWIEQQAGGGDTGTFVELNANSPQFEKKSNHQVVLYDESRRIWVMLKDNEAYWNSEGIDTDADYWYLIAQNSTGYWTSDDKFITKNGYFRRVNDGAVWIEQQAGGSCTFVEVEVKKKDPCLVVLYDESRGMWIKLADNKAYWNRKGGDPNANYWYLIAENPTGSWNSEKKFVTQTGFFCEAEDGAGWIEKQGDGCIKFTRTLQIRS